MPVQTQMQVRRGTASSWTSTNPTLAAGELGFETDTGKFKIGTGASTWTALPYAGGGQNTLTTYQYTATAGQTTFSGADINSNTLAYTAGAVQVYLNGALLQNTVDYAASTGTSVVLTAGAGLGDSLTILSLGSFTVSTDIPKSTLTAKGSIVAASGAATPANLSVGANDTVLTADSSTATGLKWAAPAGGDKWTLLNAGGTSLTGSSVTVSGISGKEKLFIVVANAVSTGGEASFRFNGVTTTSYETFGNAILGTSTYNSADVVRTQNTNQAQAPLAQYAGTSSTVNGYLLITGCASTTTHKFFTLAGGSDGGNGQTTYNAGGFAEINDAITSVTLIKTTGTFSSGTIFVYANS